MEQTTTAADNGGADTADADDGTAGTVRTNGIDTYYVRRGEGPAVVFVHGAIMDHRMWEPQLDALADDYTVVAYDVRGHGRTGGSEADPYSMDLFADDLHALVEELDLDRPVVCGLSTGGAVAQSYAVRYPDDVSGLVLADTFTPGPMGLVGRLMFANLRLFAALDRFVSYKRLNRLQLRVGERLRPGVAGGESGGATVQRLVDEGPTMSHAEFSKVMRSLPAFLRSDLDVSAVDVPTVVLYGENEPSPMRDHAARLAAAVPDAELREVPGAGHASNLDSPEFFTDVVRAVARSAFLAAPERDPVEAGAET